jgi:hypothetical protein
VDIGAFQTEDGFPTFFPTLTVTTPADPGGVFGALSLREAVGLANLYAASGDFPTVRFDPALDGDTITLTQGALILDVGSAPVPGGRETIDGGGQITVSGNNASGVFQIDGGVHANLNGLTITAGSDVFGGGILNEPGAVLAVSNSVISGNTASSGGGIANDVGQLTLTNVTLADDSATGFVVPGEASTGTGGGLVNTGSATVTLCTFTADSALVLGGGLSIEAPGSVTVTNSTFTGNTAGVGGGAIEDLDGTLTLNNSTLSENAAGGGGGLLVDSLGSSIGSATVTNTTFDFNKADFEGGGIFNRGNLTVNRSTLTLNLSQENSGGGLFIDGGTVTVQNTILAGNLLTPADGSAASPSDVAVVAGTFQDLGNNLLGAALASAAGTARKDVFADVPGLAALGNYGGPTQTMPPLPGSPALGAGNPAGAPDTDQRGFKRVVNGRTDIGAFQTQANPFLVTTAADPGGLVGLLSLREAVNLANHYAAQRTSANITFAPALNGDTVTLSGTALELFAFGTSPPGVETIDGGGKITVSGNQASGVFQLDSGVNATLNGLTITAGSALQGGGIFNGNGATLTVTNSTISGNTAGFGGGIDNESGNLTLANVTVSDNAAIGGFGGGVESEFGTLSVTNCTFSDNSASSSFGGGLETGGGSDTVTGTTFSDNAAMFGGGLFEGGESTLTVNNSFFFGNSAGDGGGLEDSGGTLKLSNSTFADNSADFGGGLGIPLVTLSGNPVVVPMTVSNCTFTGNSAIEGGGIGSVSFGTLSVSATTLVGNTAAQDGGGITIGAGTATLQNTIVAGNLLTPAGGSASNPGDISGAAQDIQDLGNNLLGAALASAAGTARKDVFTDAPGLAGLGNYGGPTPTMPPLPNSPALGAGNPAGAPATDQRGFARVVGGKTDVGAVQTQANPFVVTTAADPGDLAGQLSLREAVNLANAYAMTGSPANVTFAPALRGATITLSQGTLELSAGPPRFLFIPGGGGGITLPNPVPPGGPFGGPGPAVGTETINGGGQITVSGNNAGGVFQIDAGALVTLQGLGITGGNTVGPGGAIDNAGTLSVTGDTLWANTSTGAPGGGLFNAFTGTVALTNSTVFGNTAVGSSGGGIENQGSLMVTFATVFGNSAANGIGGGIDNQGGLTLQDSIVAGNSAGSDGDVAGPITADPGHNLLGTTVLGPLSSTDVVTNQPLLAPLGAYNAPGGPTLRTLAPLPGSPALGAGAPATGVTTDERGVARRQGSITIGAFQSQGFTLTAVSGGGQSATANTEFANALVVSVKANAAYEPVRGGLVRFSAPVSGAGAAFLSSVSPINLQGQALVLALANGTASVAGTSYAVTATTLGAPSTAVFRLTNTPLAAATGLVLVISGLPSSGSEQAGTTQTITVRVENAQGQVQTGFSGSVLLQLNGTINLQPSSGKLGVFTFTNVTLTRAGLNTLLALPPTVGAAAFGAATVTVTPAAASKVVVLNPPTLARQGVAFAVMVQVEDKFGNAVSKFAAPSTASLTTTDHQATVTRTSTAQQQASGLFVFQVRLRTTGPQTLTTQIGTLNNTIDVSVM